jgi:hypothetical protein
LILYAVLEPEPRFEHHVAVHDVELYQFGVELEWQHLVELDETGDRSVRHQAAVEVDQSEPTLDTVVDHHYEVLHEALEIALRVGLTLTDYVDECVALVVGTGINDDILARYALEIAKPCDLQLHYIFLV